MNSSSLWTDAWQTAMPVWSQVLRQAGWHPVLVAAVQAATGLLCLAIGRAGHAADGASLVWHASAVALLLLALNTLFALDLLAVQVLRHLAHLQGWRGGRRRIQALVLVLLGVSALVATLRLAQRVDLFVGALRWLVPGVALLLTVAALRAVSLHGTDALLQVRLAGISAGRLLDALGLTLVAIGIATALRARLA